MLNIILLGYMGSGKTSIGKLLSESLGYQFIDLDEYISRKENLSIAAIFQQKGEIYFRKKEHFYLNEILNSPDFHKTVLSLGGGTPCYANNMDLIKNAKDSISFYLKLSFQKLAVRLHQIQNNRPLLPIFEDQNQWEDFVRKHLFERQMDYMQADVVLDTENKSILAITQEITNHLNTI
ncbi:MAG: shikimate kinase [Bacteroidota bacterium]